MRSLVGVITAALVFSVANGVSAQPTSLSDYSLFAHSRLKVGKNAVLSAGAVGGNFVVKVKGSADVSGPVVGDDIRLASHTTVHGSVYGNSLAATGATIQGTTISPVAFPLIVLPPPATIGTGAGNVSVAPGAVQTIPAGSFNKIDIQDGAIVTLGGSLTANVFITHGSAVAIGCAAASCDVGVRELLRMTGNAGTFGGGQIHFRYAGGKTAKVGHAGATVFADFYAPFAQLKLLSSLRAPSTYRGQFGADRITVGNGAVVQRRSNPAVCGDGAVGGTEDCDPPSDAACVGTCRPDCACAGPPTGLALHSVGPSLLNNATDFGVQVFGAGFLPGAQLEIYDQPSATLIETLPATFVSSSELTALVPAGMPVPSGIQRELTARVLNPGGARSNAPDIGHCTTDVAGSPIACTSNANCPPGAGACVLGDQRLTMFNNLAFLNPNSAVVVPAPFGVCDDGTPCTGAGDCAGIGSAACSPKLYVTPQEVDELWVYNTGTGQFVDENGGAPGIQGIAVGDNPFHVELLTAGGPPRAWVINRFDDALSIIDPATDSELAHVTGAALGSPGRLRMSTEAEFAGTRAYVSNQNLDEVLVFDISGIHRDAPLLIGSVDVGVNPRGMATNTADTRLYVANIQSADVSVVDIQPGSGTENQVVATVAARATDDIVGGRADGWEAFVIGGRAPRGIIFSDDLQALFVSSIGPQTGPRAGVNQVGGAIINPTITVIDAASNAVVAHVAINGQDPNRPKCTDPELMALDDARGRLYVTCQGSGTIDILDTAALVAAAPAELYLLSLPLPADVSVPTLAINSGVTGPFGAKVCAAFTTNAGTACTSNAQCTGCPLLREGVPVECCATNNPIGLHNGPRGIAISSDTDTLYVINQFTTSVATVDVSPSDPTLAAVTATTSFPGAFGSNSQQQDRRLGQIEFFTDLKGTNTSCATCHIDDHQDGVFFEADVAGPRLRRVLSVRGTRDFPPLLQDQLVPDLVAFTDVVVHVERFGPVCTPCTELNGSFSCFPPPSGTCNMTSNAENQQNTLYAKAVTFFPNPNLNPDGSLSTAVPLPGGATGDALHGEQLFDQLACATCHPEPMFTIDQFRVFNPIGLSLQPIRMREVQTPVRLPLRAQCQDSNRPAGVDGSAGFSVPTLRGIWDTFPLLMSGSAGLQVVGSEPTFSPCTPGASGCCTQLQSPLNPGGTPVPPEHLAVSTKNALRAMLTAPLAVPATGHGAALGLTPSDLDDLIAYLRSL